MNWKPDTKHTNLLKLAVFVLNQRYLWTTEFGQKTYL